MKKNNLRNNQNSNKASIIDVMRGDIVAYNPHTNLKTYGIVCEVREDGLVYVVPITAAVCKEPDMIYLPFKTKIDFREFNGSTEEGTVLLAVGKMIFQKSIIAVTGRCNHEFFRKVLRYIPMAVNFTGDLINYNKRCENPEKKWPDPYDPYYDSPPMEEVNSENPHIPIRLNDDGSIASIGG